MQAKKLFCILFLSLFLISCTAFSGLKVTDDYRAGRKVGEEYAKKDAKDIRCGGPSRPTHVDAGIKARSYKDALEQEGKSADFIKGFNYGYQELATERIRLYCR